MSNTLDQFLALSTEQKQLENRVNEIKEQKKALGIKLREENPEIPKFETNQGNVIYKNGRKTYKFTGDVRATHQEYPDIVMDSVSLSTLGGKMKEVLPDQVEMNEGDGYYEFRTKKKDDTVQEKQSAPDKTDEAYPF